jgi:putative ABC transport system permease protein
MSILALCFTIVFILITICVSLREQLGLEKDLLISTIRSTIQLLIIGYVLKYVFQVNNFIFIVLIVLMMISVASRNAGKRGQGLDGIRWRIFGTIAFTEIITITLLVSLHIIPFTPQYIIPLSGMIIGNSMIASCLFLTQMKREVETSKGEIETLLSLGATPRRALQETLRRSVKSSMIPTIDSMKTVGLVQLPGVMTGMIIAGANPIEAVKYQILIMFMFACSAAMTSMILSLISYKMWFLKDLRLRSI